MDSVWCDVWCDAAFAHASKLRFLLMSELEPTAHRRFVINGERYDESWAD
jgi:hypothetical protein